MPATLKSRLPLIAAELRPRVSAAVKASAEAIAENAKGKAPYGPGEVHIQDHFRVERTAGAEYIVLNDAMSESGKREVPYAHMVEFGTTKNGPRPFLVPAKEEEEEASVARVQAALLGL